MYCLITAPQAGAVEAAASTLPRPMFLVDPACTVVDVLKLLRGIPPMLEAAGIAVPAAAPGPDVDMASEAVAACPVAAAAGAGGDAAPRGPWWGVRIFEVSPGIFVNERGEQCDAYLRLFISFTPTSELCAAQRKFVDFQ